jgi:hypothetical protein
MRVTLVQSLVVCIIVLYVSTYFWLHPIRIKLDKILAHTCLEICLLNKSMPPLGTFVTYWLQLSLSSCCIEDWAFSKKSIYFIAITFSVLFLLYHYTTKTQNTFIYYFLLNPLTNTLAPRGFDNLFYIKRYYNWSPPLGSHQDTFLAPLPGSSMLLVSLFGKETAVIYFSDYF